MDLLASMEPHHINVMWDGTCWRGEGARFLDYLSDVGGLRYPTRIDIQVMTHCSVIRGEVPDMMIPDTLRSLSISHPKRLAWIRSTLGGIPGDPIEQQIPSVVPVRLQPQPGAVIIGTCWRLRGT